MKNPVAEFDHIYHFFKINQDASINHLHVYFEVITGDSWLKEYHFPFKEFLLANRKRDDKTGVFVLDNKAQAYILL